MKLSIPAFVSLSLAVSACGGAPVCPTLDEDALADRVADRVIARLVVAAGGDAAGDTGGADEAEAPPERDEHTVYYVPVTGNEPWRGAPDALVTIVELTDFQCPFCRRVEPVIDALLRAYPGDLRVVVLQNPLPFHGDARPAANAALEALTQRGNDAYFAMHDRMMAPDATLDLASLERYGREARVDARAIRTAVESRRYDAVIDEQSAVGTGLGFGGTPSFFINGRSVVGAQPLDAFRTVIDEELARARALVASGVARGDVYARTIADGVRDAE